MKSGFSVLALLLASCASHYDYKATDSATLRVVGNTPNFYVEAYEDMNCVPSKAGTRLATFYGPTKDVASHETGKTVSISSGKPFVLTHRYIDARFAQNRTCSVTVSFVPEAGKTYQTYFYVEPDVSGCDTFVSGPSSRAGENVASFQYNENLCLGGANKGPMNRQAVWINWKANVQHSTGR